jgi:hypothetical protein
MQVNRHACTPWHLPRISGLRTAFGWAARGRQERRTPALWLHSSPMQLRRAALHPCRLACAPLQHLQAMGEQPQQVWLAPGPMPTDDGPKALAAALEDSICPAAQKNNSVHGQDRQGQLTGGSHQEKLTGQRVMRFRGWLPCSSLVTSKASLRRHADACWSWGQTRGEQKQCRTTSRNRSGHHNACKAAASGSAAV